MELWAHLQKDVLRSNRSKNPGLVEQSGDDIALEVAYDKEINYKY